MKVLSVRRGFLADHSSTSYEFLAVDKPLDTKARAAVGKLSSRVRPSSRRASFIYHVEGYDIPGGWGALMARYYDVMYSESYDWWTLAVAFDMTNKELVAKIRKYAFRGVEDLGVDVSYRDNRVVVTIHCRLDAGQMFDPDNDDDGRCEEGEDDAGDVPVPPDDSLLDLLMKMRKVLMNGDCHPLYAVWEVYGGVKDDGVEPPRPRKTKHGASVASELARILESM